MRDESCPPSERHAVTTRPTMQVWDALLACRKTYAASSSPTASAATIAGMRASYAPAGMPPAMLHHMGRNKTLHRKTIAPISTLFTLLVGSAGMSCQRSPKKLQLYAASPHTHLESLPDA